MAPSHPDAFEAWTGTAPASSGVADAGDGIAGDGAFDVYVPASTRRSSFVGSS
jgi:hypothetical protein